MSPTRERLRRAASVVVLIAGVGVLVATSPPEAKTREEFEFEPITFDGRAEVIEGLAGPVGEIPPNWEYESLYLTVIADRTAELYLEAFDDEGTVISSVLSTGDEIPTGSSHELSAGRYGCPRKCRGPVSYWVQRLDGGPITIELRVSISLSEYDATDRADVPLEASPPAIAPRSGAARSSVLGSFGVEATRTAPVAAVHLTWDSGSCNDGATTRIAVSTSSRSVPMRERWSLRLLGGASDPTLARDLRRDDTGPVGTLCELRTDGRARHTSWIVLSTLGPEVSADLVVVGPARNRPLTIERADVVPVWTRPLRGEGKHDHVQYTAEPGIPAGPRGTDGGALPIYVLAVEVPTPPGVRAGYRLSGPAVQTLSEDADGYRGLTADLHIGVDIRGGDASVDPDEVRATAVAYEIRVPGT